jgi:predicted transcriptional regulator
VESGRASLHSQHGLIPARIEPDRTSFGMTSGGFGSRRAKEPDGCSEICGESRIGAAHESRSRKSNILRVGNVARLAMGELEATVMDILWDNGGWMTAAEVLEVLSKKRPITYTTVMTILVRLWRKERLLRQSVGRAYAYRPSQLREEYAASQMAQILITVENRPVALNLFVERLPPRDQKQLQRFLRQHEGEENR